MSEKEKEIAKVKAKRTIRHEPNNRESQSVHLKAAQRQQEDWIIVRIM